ncbi:MAG: hypothetical protein JXC85_02660 [Candidatus Aenigmarchaeota archaeon]|nr:hypothetical protein [Candidatus Aenigmarchaeota archaeon]
MPHFRISIDNNILAALAIILTITSMFNFIIALGVVETRRMEAAASASGEVKLCASFMPNLTFDDYHLISEEVMFVYDVNVSENETLVNFSDTTPKFDINLTSGIINFTPDDADVGVWNVTIIATETVCSLQDYKVMTFNVTPMNESPVLISLVFTNGSSNGTNATYYFPVNVAIELYEDVWYNLSVIAYDPDLPNDTLTYGVLWYDPPGIFVLDTATGKSSFMPVQSEVGDHMANFNVFDLSYLLDSSDANFTVFNTNDAPVLLNKTVLRSQTAYSGEPYVLYVNASDEDGDTMAFDVQFIDCNQTLRNLSDQNCSIFRINHTLTFPTLVSGVITFTPLLIDVGNYTVNFTVADGNGGVDWQLGNFTVVEFMNHEPNITDWYPRNAGAIKNATHNVTTSEGQSQHFNITVYDPDCGWGCASSRWYRDGAELVAYQNQYNFTWLTKYSDSGIYNITVIVSDGELTDSVEWKLVILDEEPPKPPPSGGGGILGGITPCQPNWRCTVWSVCSNEGVQIRECMDLSSCNSTLGMPEVSRICTYTPFPDCYDSIRNCHDGLCEILTDCGGPCPPCPTCSDGIQNCHIMGECEEKVDCGGPCPPCPTIPREAVCGNQVCEAGEIYDCMEDCLEFWIDMAIFVVIVILLIVISVLLYVYRKETVLLYVYRRVRGERA